MPLHYLGAGLGAEIILFRLNNGAYNVPQLYYYEKDDTNHTPHTEPVGGASCPAFTRFHNATISLQI